MEINADRLIPHTSLETTRLVEMLRPSSVGAVVGYDELSAKIGKDVRTVGHGHLATALRILAREANQAWGNIRKVGIKRLDSGETLDASKDRVRRAGRQIHRARKQLSLVDYNSLSLDKKREHDALAVLTGVARTAISSQSVSKVALGLPGNAELPRQADVLRLIGMGKE